LEKRPWRQLKQVDAFKNWPRLQVGPEVPDEEEDEGVHEAEPGGATKPWAQLRQEVELVTAVKVSRGHSRQLAAPKTLEKRPMGQKLQLIEPSTDWKEPARQSRQAVCLALFWKEPGRQRAQLAALEMSEKRPGAQLTQEEAPVKVPGAQDCEPPDEEDEAGVQDEAPVGATKPWSQLMHVVELVAGA
jgi:hypothetical protein